MDEGVSQAVYPLDESLIDFGTAIDDRDYLRAIDILDDLDVTSEVEAMWQQLSSMAVASGDIRIAQRCAAAMGDVASSRFLTEMKAVKARAEEELGHRANDHYLVRSKLALLRKDLKGAEHELLAQGKVEECIEMYQKLSKHDEAIRVAEQSRLPEAYEMRQAYFQYLVETNQEEQAAALKEREGDYIQSVNLYLKASLPGRAAQVTHSTHCSIDLDVLLSTDEY